MPSDPIDQAARERLTEADVPGWYECEHAQLEGRRLVLYWNGEKLSYVASGETTSKPFTKFIGPLVPAQHFPPPASEPAERPKCDVCFGKGYIIDSEGKGFSCPANCEDSLLTWAIDARTSDQISSLQQRLSDAERRCGELAKAVLSLAEFAQSKGVFILDESKELVKEATEP